MARILVVDDEAQVRTILRRALEERGHLVEEARHGVEGLSACRRERPDLVLTDILMPEKEGLDLIVELRQMDASLPVIALSGGSRLFSMDLIDVARKLGARRAFWKPFDLDDVVAAVEEELRPRAA